MATPVGHIEKEFILKVMFDEKLPILYIKERTEYTLKLEYPVTNELVLRCEKPIGKLKTNTKMHLLCNYKGQVIDFNTEATLQKGDLISCKMPDMLYKNLDRNYLRIDVPSDLKILFTFQGDRYNLAFPKVSEYENIETDNLAQNMDSRNLSGLIKQIASSLSKFSDGYKIVNFKDKKPETIEERIVSELGKALFIPSTEGFLPKTDPYPKKRIITEDLFKDYLEKGIGAALLDESCARFLKRKFEEGVFSDAWIPILFQEYVIGYIRIWISTQGKPLFDFNVLDNTFQLTKVLAFALKENGYFEHGKMTNEPFEGRVLDISASGLLFACPLGSHLLTTLFVGADLTVSIITPNRTVNVLAKIVRLFKDRNAGYLGCRFTEMAPEDKRFLFEYLYGRQIDDRDSAFLTGQV
jgi:c-di-GMP-binding flagellar brake protein YcgR